MPQSRSFWQAFLVYLTQTHIPLSFHIPLSSIKAAVRTLLYSSPTAITVEPCTFRSNLVNLMSIQYTKDDYSMDMIQRQPERPLTAIADT